MIVPEEKISLSKLRAEEPFYFEDILKGVVDLEKEIVAIHAEMHVDLEEVLLNEFGSIQKNLYGFNIFWEDGLIELDSNINIPRNADLGNPRGGRMITDATIVEKVESIVSKWIELDS